MSPIGSGRGQPKRNEGARAAHGTAMNSNSAGLALTDLHIGLLQGDAVVDPVTCGIARGHLVAERGHHLGGRSDEGDAGTSTRIPASSRSTPPSNR